MSETFNVNVDELRASASFARSIGDELGGPIDTALKDNAGAEAQLAGWSMGLALEQLGADWAPALAALRARLTDTAANLEATAQGHEWTDHSIADLTKGLGVR
ncbi:type VII secretion target [Kitasatospora sp. NPDC002227]|uniref:type VII secretion target n=1 Tax=Kitasatospora sp. NPDC002227 TaxID=3154773 RepID=UPI00332C83BE